MLALMKELHTVSKMSALIRNVYRHYLWDDRAPSIHADKLDKMWWHLNKMQMSLWYSNLKYHCTGDRNEQITSVLYESRGMKFRPKRWWKFWRWGEE